MTIADLFSHVYGPYLDEKVLRDSFPTPKSGTKLELDDLELYCGAEAIGFDQSEYITNPPASSPLAKNPAVMFCGVLEINDLDCLSDVGLKYLEYDVNEYDQKIHVVHAPRSMSIRRLYSETRARLKIRILCHKNLLAHYLTSDNDPEKLLIFSRSGQIRRTYWVHTLNVRTFDQSRKFLDRYRLRALIVELTENDPDDTPLHKRTIDWLIERYLNEMRPRDQDHRLIQASDLDPRKADKPRHLRHISRSELKSRFAEHAEWLLANQIASNGPNTKLVDINQWILFCKKSWRYSLDAQRHGAKWGLCRRNRMDPKKPHDLAKNLAEFGQDKVFWEQQLKNSSQHRRSVKNRKELTPEPSNTASTALPIFQYDSDFSEPTTSEDSEFESVPPYKNMEVPGFLHKPPTIRNGYFIWYCPGCAHVIDLLSIPPGYVALLPPEIVHVIKGTRSWKVDDGPIQEALHIMVSHHYTTQHLAPKNLQLTRVNSAFYLTEIKTGSERNPSIKTEESLSQEAQLRRSVRKSKPPRRLP